MFDEKYFTNKVNSTWAKADSDIRAHGIEKLGAHDIHFRLSRLATPMVEYSEIKRILADIDAPPLLPSDPSGSRRCPIAWGRASRKYKEIAEKAEKNEHFVTTGINFIRASLLAHSGQLFCRPEWPEKVTLQKERALCFRRGAPYAGLEEHKIPYKNSTLPGYLWIPKETDNPPFVIMVPGANSTKEELYRWAPAFVERKMAVFFFDGPGQGELTSLQKSPLLMRLEEYHNVFTSIIDYFTEIASDRIDLKRIALWGQSLGGHLLIRAFEHEKRPIAAVSVGGPPDMKAWPYIPGDCLEEGRDMCGFKTFQETWEYLQKNGDAISVAKHVKVPILMIHGSRDDLMPEESVRKMAEEIGPNAEFVAYSDGNHGVFNWDFMLTDMMADWLVEKLDIKEVKGK